jgi:simple sugar transport system ATP-binding protein
MPAGERESARQPALTEPVLAALEPTAGEAEQGVKRLELRHISKSFGGVRVLQDVSIELGTSEVVGLLGDNGAGKSTLIKIITGVHQPDEGEIYFGGRRITDMDVHKARALGVETVFQERALADQLPLWRNIFMGRPLSGRFGFLKVDEMRRATADLMGESMGFTSAVLTPNTNVKGLSGGERQGLAIVRALHFQAEIIILDEPTMGLSLKETEKLLTFVEGIRAAHKSAIFIDHNIFHVYSVSDRIVLLDRGRVAGQFLTSRYSLNELMDIMREVAATGAYTEQERYRRGDATPPATTVSSEEHA